MQSAQNLEQIASADQLNELMSDPTPAAIEAMRAIHGDLLVLGVAGKMGPSLARMAVKASAAAGVARQVIGVARFSNPDERKRLEDWGIKTIKADLLDRQKLRELPDAPNIMYMAGMKFGSTGQEALTWAMNTYLPGMVCERWSQSRIVAFSTGNVYGVTPLHYGGSVESDTPRPIGDYAMSCLGRERIFDHFSRQLQIPMTLLRLNYACECRYGVLVDLARKVWTGQPIDLAMGNFNVVWQGDANAVALAAFSIAASPAATLNIAGPEILSVRRVCEQFGKMFSKPPQFSGVEAPDALLNNAQRSHRLFGYPRVTADQLIRWIADWIQRGESDLGKPTHFETRDGKY